MQDFFFTPNLKIGHYKNLKIIAAVFYTMEYKTIWNGNGPRKVCPSPSIKPLC
jgi:hypothetical protein